MKWNNAPEDIEPYQGFVYLVTHNKTGRYYIGKKFFWSKKTRPPLKGRKNKRHYRVESDWKNYCTSSPTIQELVSKEGVKAFDWTIIHLCDNKFDCAYKELEEQINHRCLFDSNCYNQVINVRLRKRK